MSIITVYTQTDFRLTNSGYIYASYQARRDSREEELKRETMQKSPQGKTKTVNKTARHCTGHRNLLFLQGSGRSGSSSGGRLAATASGGSGTCGGLTAPTLSPEVREGLSPESCPDDDRKRKPGGKGFPGNPALDFFSGEHTHTIAQ